MTEVWGVGPKRPPPQPLSARKGRRKRAASARAIRNGRPLRARRRNPTMPRRGSPASAANKGTEPCLYVSPTEPEAARSDGVVMAMMLVAPVLPGVTAGGAKETVAPAGSPVADSVTALLKAPPEEETAMLKCATAPEETFCEAVEELTANAPVAGPLVPVPVSVVAWGDPAALSTREIKAAKLAAETGLKLTAMVQVAPAASVAPQVVVSAKSAEPAPVTVMPEMLRVALPGFESVTVWAAEVAPTVVLGKASVAVERTACGPEAAVPVPVSWTCWGDPR
jgi:hypothetical protein